MTTLLAGIAFTAVAAVLQVLWIGSSVRRGYPKGRAARPHRWTADAADLADLVNRVSHRDLDVEGKRRELNRIVAEEFEHAGAEEGARTGGGPRAGRAAPRRWSGYSGIDSVGSVRGLGGDLESVRTLLSRMERRTGAHG